MQETTVKNIKINCQAFIIVTIEHYKKKEKASSMKKKEKYGKKI